MQKVQKNKSQICNYLKQTHKTITTSNRSHKYHTRIKYHSLRIQHSSLLLNRLVCRPVINVHTDINLYQSGDSILRTCFDQQIERMEIKT